MRALNRTASLGAVILGLSLIGNLVYQIVLYPASGFPTEDFGVVVAGANTLRVGHLLKFGYASGLALILVGFYSRAQASSPILAQLAAISGTAAATLFLGSGMLGLRILQVAEETYSTKPTEAITTILLRSVTVSLFEAAILASGLFAMLVSVALLRSRAIPVWLAGIGIVVGVLFILDRVLFQPLSYVSPFLAIVWCIGLVLTLTMNGKETRTTA